MAKDTDLLSAAIAATEVEIFDSAFNKTEGISEDDGDRSLEMIGDGLEGQHEADDENGESDDEPVVEETEGTADEPSETAEENSDKPDPKTAPELAKPDGRVPPGRLREQTERTRAAEAERDGLKTLLETERANAKKDLDALNAKLDGVLTALQRQQTAAPTAPKTDTAPAAAPDMFEDPEGFRDHLIRQFETQLHVRDQRFEQMRIENSLQLAHSKHGDVFAKAYQEFTEAGKTGDPETIAAGQRILQSANPGEALVTWHKHNTTLREVGSDPAAFRERIAAETRQALMQDAEFRKQFLEELTAEAGIGDNGRPRTITHLPPSLNRAIGGSSRTSEDRHGLDGSDQAIFDSLFPS